jgi:hypothetical protein
VSLRITGRIILTTVSNQMPAHCHKIHFNSRLPCLVAPVTTQTAQQAFTSVLVDAGCTLPNRDSADIRVINEINSGVAPFGATYNVGGKGIIDSPSDVGGWPANNSLPAPVDSDHDAIPDNWEIAHGLNPNDPSDRNTIATSGYTMLEEYLNSIAGQTGIVSVDEHTIMPEDYNLKQNYPNPFNPSTTITFSVGTYSYTSLRMYDIYGREVATLVDGFRSTGSYTVEFNGSNLPGGVYFARLHSKSFSQTIKLILVK